MTAIGSAAVCSISLLMPASSYAMRALLMRILLVSHWVVQYLMYIKPNVCIYFFVPYAWSQFSPNHPAHDINKMIAS